MRMRFCFHRSGDLVRRRAKSLQMADGADRRAVAGAHTRRAHHTHVPAQLARQFLQEFFRAGHGARQRVADAHGNGRRRRTVLHHVEMRIEGRYLINFGERHLHLKRQCREVRSRKIAIVVLNKMQMLDEQIAPARPIGQQRQHVGERDRIDLTALGRTGRPAPATCAVAFPAGTRRSLNVHDNLQP